MIGQLFVLRVQWQSSVISVSNTLPLPYYISIKARTVLIHRLTIQSAIMLRYFHYNSLSKLAGCSSRLIFSSRDSVLLLPGLATSEQFRDCGPWKLYLSKNARRVHHTTFQRWPKVLLKVFSSNPIWSSNPEGFFVKLESSTNLLASMQKFEI